MGNAADPAPQVPGPAAVTTHVEELYTAHVRLVRSVCRSLLRDRNEAEDAVQQTFLSAQRALANGSSPREPAAWLATIARNECLARVRERMREPLPMEDEPTAVGADAHSAAVSRYEVATLRGALADLPRLQREAILLRELRGLSYDEVARTLSTTTASVESLIFRARRTLQVKLGEALTAVSPFALFGRLLAAGGGDSVGPAVVAKVAAIGIGAALLAGGAALGPHTFGIGHAAVKTQRAAAPPVHVQPAPAAISAPPAPVWSKPPAAAPIEHSDTHQVERADTSQAERETSVTEKASTDTKESSAPVETESESQAVASVSTATTPGPPPSQKETGDSRDSGGSDN